MFRPPSTRGFCCFCPCPQKNLYGIASEGRHYDLPRGASHSLLHPRPVNPKSSWETKKPPLAKKLTSCLLWYASTVFFAAKPKPLKKKTHYTITITTLAVASPHGPTRTFPGSPVPLAHPVARCGPPEVRFFSPSTWAMISAYGEQKSLGQAQSGRRHPLGPPEDRGYPILFCSLF